MYTIHICYLQSRVVYVLYRWHHTCIYIHLYLYTHVYIYTYDICAIYIYGVHYICAIYIYGYIYVIYSLGFCMSCDWNVLYFLYVLYLLYFLYRDNTHLLHKLGLHVQVADVNERVHIYTYIHTHMYTYTHVIHVQHSYLLYIVSRSVYSVCFWFSVCSVLLIFSVPFVFSVSFTFSASFVFSV